MNIKGLTSRQHSQSPASILRRSSFLLTTSSYWKSMPAFRVGSMTYVVLIDLFALYFSVREIRSKLQIDIRSRILCIPTSAFESRVVIYAFLSRCGSVPWCREWRVDCFSFPCTLRSKMTSTLDSMVSGIRFPQLIITQTPHFEWLKRFSVARDNANITSTPTIRCRFRRHGRYRRLSWSGRWSTGGGNRNH